MRSLLILLALTSAASADTKKPSANAAKGVAVAWAKAMIDLDATNPKAAQLDRLAKLTGTPFRSFIYDDKAHCDATVTERDKLADTLACIRGTSASILPLKPYTPAVLKELWADLRDRKPEIEKLAKTHVLLAHFERGEDLVEFAVVAVTADPDGTPRVAAVIAGSLTK